MNMSTPLQTLIESEEMATLMDHNQELISEINGQTEGFVDVIAEYVYRNPEVFVDSTIENIAKNIRVFSEVAMAQFLSEITAANAPRMEYVEPVTPENAIDDYI